MGATTITTARVPSWVSLLVLWGCSTRCTSSRSSLNGSSWASAFTLVPPSAYRCIVSPLFAEEPQAVWEENWIDQCETGSEISTGIGGSDTSEGKDPFSPELTDKILPATTYRLGLLGTSFETGKLAEQIFNLLKPKVKTSNAETREALLYFALDAAAQQATKAALAQNQLEFVQEERQHTPGEWGDVEEIRLSKSNSTFPNFDEALHHWTLGEDFDFVVNNVPAKPRLLSYDEMADVLDPDGSLRKSLNTTVSQESAQFREEAMLTIFDDDLQGSFSHVYQDALHRSRHAASTASATPYYAGDDSRGYRPIAREALRATNTTILEPVAMHVMNSLVSHGVLLVDISNGGQNLALARQVADFWKAVGGWADALPTRSTDTQSIVLGRHRASGKIISVGSNSGGVSNIDLQSLHSSVQSIWDLLVEIGKDVTRIVTATCSVENGAFIEGEDNNVTKQQQVAEKAASLAVKELVDDGHRRVNLRWGRTQTAQSSAPSASDLTILRYKDIGPLEQQMQEFRARVDNTIVTLVPLSVLDGLEVFDDESEQWYRPELKALAFDRKSMPISNDGSTVPWHAHYVAVLPGSILQLLSRNEVPSAVSRLGEVTDTRTAVTFSLRGKEDATFQLDRYLGGSMGSGMLTECEGRTMERLQNRTFMSGYFV